MVLCLFIRVLWQLEFRCEGASLPLSFSRVKSNTRQLEKRRETHMKIIIAILSPILAFAIYTAVIAQSSVIDVAAIIDLVVSGPDVTANVPLELELTSGEVISMMVTINLSEDETVRNFEVQDAQVFVLPSATPTPAPTSTPTATMEPTPTTAPTVEPTPATASEDEEESEYEIVNDLVKVLDERDGTFGTVYFYRATGRWDGGPSPMLFRMNREKMVVLPDFKFSRCYVRPGEYKIKMENNLLAFTGFLNASVEMDVSIEADDVLFIKGGYETDWDSDTFILRNVFWRDAVNEIASHNMEYHRSEKCVTSR